MDDAHSLSRGDTFTINLISGYSLVNYSRHIPCDRGQSTDQRSWLYCYNLENCVCNKIKSCKGGRYCEVICIQNRNKLKSFIFSIIISIIPLLTTIVLHQKRLPHNIERIQHTGATLANNTPPSYSMSQGNALYKNLVACCRFYLFVCFFCGANVVKNTLSSLSSLETLCVKVSTKSLLTSLMSIPPNSVLTLICLSRCPRSGSDVTRNSGYHLQMSLNQLKRTPAVLRTSLKDGNVIRLG